MLELVQDNIRKKLELAKMKTVEAEEKHKEVLKKVDLENTAELNKIKTLLGEQREVTKRNESNTICKIYIKGWWSVGKGTCDFEIQIFLQVGQH